MRKNEFIANYLFFAPLLISPLFAWSICLSFSKPDEGLWIMSAAFLTGFVLFLKAKLSVIRQGKLFTFGPSHMTGLNRVLYSAGYGIMVISLFMFIGFGVAVT